MVGGGVAGVAAAVASARAGASTALVERFGCAGGLVLWFLSLDDGKGRKIVGCLPAEMVERMEKFGAAAADSGWKKGALAVRRLSALFNPEALNGALTGEAEFVLDEAICRRVAAKTCIPKGSRCGRGCRSPQRRPSGR